MNKTILYEKHLALNAKMSPFGGYLMPIQYGSIIREHNATREKAAIFDTCHMGEFLIKGKSALSDLERLLSCSVSDIKPGQCRYGFLCNESGGVIDDQILYRLDEEEFFMVVNASTEKDDFSWIKDHLSADVTLQNLTSQTAKIDLQGPLSPKIFQKLMEKDISQMRYYHFQYNYYCGEKVLTSRTGYTGEIGFEIYSTPDLALSLWDDCLESGAVAAGLGCRDTLRLEMGYPLYGHELSANTNAAESCFTRAIADKKFIGSEIVLDPNRKKQCLVGIVLQGRRAARQGDPIFDSQDNQIGQVTSGSFSPTLQCAIALGYTLKEVSPVFIKTDRGELKGEVTGLPFYKKATGREQITRFL